MINIISSIKNRLSKREVSYFNLNKLKGAGFHYNQKKFITHNQLEQIETAFFRSNPEQLIIILALALLVILGLIANWHLTLIITMAVLTFIYFADLLFNLYLIYRSFAKDPEIKIKKVQFSNKVCPTYTILCPLYKEAKILNQFIKAMENLDYPKNKLQILLLIESDDTQTYEAAKALKLKAPFQIVVVPDSMPKTKPKACNYGLTQANGDYIVVFDAEDIPEPQQLKKVVLAFQNASNQKIGCIQAKLNFYNPRQNLLTRIFTAEYSTWFDLILTGLQSLNAPIPLGGTSNHFPLTLLKKLGGWDAFNVTEDCDLGMRLVKKGYSTAIVNSTTWEEANSENKNWFWQRTRWIKGYVQTYLVHMRKPYNKTQGWNKQHLLAFQFVVGGKVLAALINPVMWTLTITYFVLRSIFGPFIETLFPGPILYMAFFCLVFGNFLYIYYYMIGCAKREQYDLIKYVFLVPLYWLAMSIAAWVAVYKFLASPHQWFKTQHGLHLLDLKNKIPAHILEFPHMKAAFLSQDFK